MIQYITSPFFLKSMSHSGIVTKFIHIVNIYTNTYLSPNYIEMIVQGLTTRPDRVTLASDLGLAIGAVIVSGSWE
jgi:hypothetical protein